MKLLHQFMASSLTAGDRHAARGSLSSALPHYQAAIALLPQTAAAYQRLCQALSQLGHAAEAIGCCGDALRGVAD